MSEANCYIIQFDFLEKKNRYYFNDHHYRVSALGLRTNESITLFLYPDNKMTKIL